MTTNRWKRALLSAASALLGAALLGSPPAQARDFIDADGRPLALPPLIEHTIAGYDPKFSGELPPVEERIPLAPMVVDPTEFGRSFGVHGGAWRMLINKAKRVRYGVVYGYARLVGYGPDYRLRPDILLDVDVVEGRIFTMRLRPGHRWSDGHPFTSEDFRYWWEDVANHPELSPSGPPTLLLVDGEPPIVTYPDETTVVFEWRAPNPLFLKGLAAAAPTFIYRPAHYMKQYHVDYTDADALAAQAEEAGVRSWAALHNSKDNMYKSDNPDLPTLQPWHIAGVFHGRRFVWLRNAFFHRIDARGRQLPYIDYLEMSVASGGLIPAKAASGEAELQAHAIAFPDVAILKQEEERGGYQTMLWRSGVAAQIAIYPNLNYGDPAWREVMRDVRFRRALSLAVDRALISRVLYFDLARPAANALLPESPLYDPAFEASYAEYDIDRANALLDEMGLTERAPNGIRLLPDGRPMEIVVEIADTPAEAADALELIEETWREVGVRLLVRPIDRDSLRKRVYAGAAMMAVWYGWENGLASSEDPPDYLAPMHQSSFQWPKWGQHYQTKGEVGEAPDTPEGEELMRLGADWAHADTEAERTRIWRRMLAIHAENVFIIGVVNGAPQPIVVSDRMRNVPEDAVWSWDPGAQFGVHRPDLFYFEPEPIAEANAEAATEN